MSEAVLPHEARCVEPCPICNVRSVVLNFKDECTECKICGSTFFSTVRKSNNIPDGEVDESRGNPKGTNATRG